MNVSEVVKKVSENRKRVNKEGGGGGGGRRVWRLELICPAGRIQAVKEEPSLIT